MIKTMKRRKYWVKIIMGDIYLQKEKNEWAQIWQEERWELKLSGFTVSEFKASCHSLTV